VGQYQHDMPKSASAEALSGVVEDCVNAVGVDVNTASRQPAAERGGLTAATAKNIVKYRENGAFTSRRQLLKVPKLGPKAFEQCAGFLRVPESKDPLDNTAVHPESYAAAESCWSCAAIRRRTPHRGHSRWRTARKVGAIGRAESGVWASACPPCRTCRRAAASPGRDPRDELPRPMLRTDVLEMKDLKPGMKLTGTVRNVIDFGAFVDIGVHQDGLVHVSQVADRYVKHPSEVVSVGDVVRVTVLEVDEKKGRISLSMRHAPGPARP
jgi:uncharacterized protein